MNLFLCLVRQSGAPVAGETCERYAAMRCCEGLDQTWTHGAGFAALTAVDEVGFGPSTARWGSRIAVGTVRLDNRADIARSLEGDARGLTDLELVLRFVAQHGEPRIRDLLG